MCDAVHQTEEEENQIWDAFRKLRIIHQLNTSELSLVTIDSQLTYIL